MVTVRWLPWALLGASLVVTATLLVGRLPSPSTRASPSGEAGASPVLDDNHSRLLTAILDSQNETLRAIRQTHAEQQGVSPAGTGSFSSERVADEEARWLAEVRQAERALVAEQVVRFRMALMTEAATLRTRLKGLKADDPQLQVTEQQLRDIDEGLRQLPRVRTVEELVRFRFDFSSVLRS